MTYNTNGGYVVQAPLHVNVDLDSSGNFVGISTAAGSKTIVTQATDGSLTAGGVAVSVGGAKAPPTAFAWDFTTYPMYINSSTQGASAVSLAPESMIDPLCFAGVLYYVSPTGSDAANGTTPLTPVASIWKAIQLGNATSAPYRIKVAAGTYYRANSFTNNSTVFPTQSLMIEATGGRVVTGAFDSLSWAVDGTFTNTYSTTRGGTVRVFNTTTLDESGDYTELTMVADAATCNTTPGSWVLVGSTLYVRRSDGAAVTNINTRAYLSVACVIHPIGCPAMYVKGVDCEGSTDVLGVVGINGDATNLTPRKSAWVNCSMKYSGSAASMNNGVAAVGFYGLIAFFGCNASNNAADGFNAHNSLGSRTHLLTVNCTGFNNGKFTSQSNNGLTVHETVAAIDVGGEYARNHGGNIRNINTSQMWCVGSKIHDDLGDVALGGSITPTQIRVDNSAKIWLDGCSVYGAGTSLAAYDTGSILYRNTTLNGGSQNQQAGATIGTY